MRGPLLALALACRQEDPLTPLATGLTGNQARAMAICDAAPRLQRDWCAVHLMEGNSAEPGEVRGTWGSGEQVAKICPRMVDPSARDWCLELAARSQEPQPPADVCDGVRSEDLRQSCHLAMADRLSSASASIATIAEHCLASGPLLDDCLYHVPPRRVSHYRKEGPATLAAEARALVGHAPRAAELPAFGIAVARAALSLGVEAGSPLDPCASLGTSEAARACSFTLLDPDEAWAAPGTVAGDLQ